MEDQKQPEKKRAGRPSKTYLRPAQPKAPAKKVLPIENCLVEAEAVLRAIIALNSRLDGSPRDYTVAKLATALAKTYFADTGRDQVPPHPPLPPAPDYIPPTFTWHDSRVIRKSLDSGT